MAETTQTTTTPATDQPKVDPPGTKVEPSASPEQDRPNASTALAVARAGTMQQAFTGLMPTSIGEAYQLSCYLAKSKAVPGKQPTPETVLTIVLAGMELGLTPIRALQSISNIGGNLCMKADLQLALAQSKNVLDFYEEGFEYKGKSDGNLKRRLTLSLQAAKPPVTGPPADLVFEKIVAQSHELADGGCYGWAVGRRRGSDQVHVRTFTMADAQRAVIWEASEDGSGPKEKKPLSEKFNYKSFPGDMYPKRARTRLLQILASDVTNGLPALESLEGGQAPDLDIQVTGGSQGDGLGDADALMADMRDINLEQATIIEQGFRQLSMGKAHQIQKLNEYKGHPDKLVLWLKDEYAKRRGADGVKRPDVLDAEIVSEPAKPVTATVTTQNQPPADIATDKAKPGPKPVEPKADTKPTNGAQSAALRMKQSLTTF